MVANAARSAASDMLYQRKGERAGLDAGQIDRREPEPGSTYPAVDLGPRRFADRPDEIADGQFDARDVTVVPDPEIGETNCSDCCLGLLDLSELGRRDFLVVRDARRQARRGRFARAG